MIIKDQDEYEDYELKYQDEASALWLRDAKMIAEQIEAWIGDGILERQAFARSLRDNPGLVTPNAPTTATLRYLKAVWEKGELFEGFVLEARANPVLITEPFA